MDPRGGELPPLPSASHKPVRATPQVLWVSAGSMREGGGGGDKFVRRRSVVARTPTLDPSPQGGGCRLVNEVVVKTSSPNHRAARGLDPRVWCHERIAVGRRVAHGSSPWAARWVGVVWSLRRHTPTLLDDGLSKLSPISLPSPQGGGMSTDGMVMEQAVISLPPLWEGSKVGALTGIVSPSSRGCPRA